jgi:hypothetical protein
MSSAAQFRMFPNAITSVRWQRSAAVGVITATAARRISRRRSVHALGCAVANPPESDDVPALIDVTQLYLSPPRASKWTVGLEIYTYIYSIAGMHGYHYDVSHGASTAQISLDIITALAQQNALGEQIWNAFALAQILSNSLRQYRKLNRKVPELRILKNLRANRPISRDILPRAQKAPNAAAKLDATVILSQ